MAVDVAVLAGQSTSASVHPQFALAESEHCEFIWLCGEINDSI